MRIVTMEDLEELRKLGAITIPFPSKDMSVALCFLDGIIDSLMRQSNEDINIPLDVLGPFMDIAIPTASKYLRRMEIAGAIKLYKLGLPGRTYIVNRYR